MFNYEPSTELQNATFKPDITKIAVNPTLYTHATRSPHGMSSVLKPVHLEDEERDYDDEDQYQTDHEHVWLDEPEQ